MSFDLPLLLYWDALISDESIPIQMHMLENQVDWIQSNQNIGFGLISEQGAKSMHARFNRLYQAYTA